MLGSAIKKGTMVVNPMKCGVGKDQVELSVNIQSALHPSARSVAEQTPTSDSAVKRMQ
jgi:hypothetical protein